MSAMWIACSSSVINKVQTVMTWFCHKRHWYSAHLWRRNESLSIILSHLHVQSVVRFTIAPVNVSLVILLDTFVQIFGYCLPLSIWFMMSVMNVKGYTILNKLFNTMYVCYCVHGIDRECFSDTQNVWIHYKWLNNRKLRSKNDSGNRKEEKSRAKNR